MIEMPGNGDAMSAVRDAVKHWGHVAPLLTMPADETDYDARVRALDEVLDQIGDDDDHPLASLAARIDDVIAAYDEAHRPMPKSSGVEALKYPMVEHDLAQRDLPEVGTQSVISDVLSGRRRLNVRQIAALADRFNLPASVFIDRSKAEIQSANLSTTVIRKLAQRRLKTPHRPSTTPRQRNGQR